MITEARPGLDPWQSINWRKVEAEVRRLQVRIVKAEKKGHGRTVRKLQNLLVRSQSARLLAVRRVTTNRGKKTPGVDGKVLKTPRGKWDAATNLSQKGYCPSPLRRVYISKSNGKMRPLGIPTMIDRIHQDLHRMGLEPVMETRSDPNSYGFRPKRSVHDAIGQCLTVLAGHNRAEWILEADIKGCFDNISHQWLAKNTPTDKRTLRKWLEAGFLESGVLHETKAGTPQGGIISPCLCDVALNGLEETILSRFREGRRNANKVHVVRYADDFIVTGNSKEVLIDEIKPLVVQFLEVRGLQLSEEKTHVVHIESGFDFLGFNVRKYKKKLLIKPSQKSIKAVCRKVRDTFRAHRGAKALAMIGNLNPIIGGWANHFKSVVSKDAFQRIDTAIWKSSWRWAKRRHSRKSSSWIVKRYYTRKGARNWIFTDRGANLKIMAQTPIKRHTKIKGAANPYDPEWEAYFEKRWERQWMFQNKFRWKVLWRKQKGQCPACGRKLNEDDELDVHHRKPRVLGGDDSFGNLVLLHSICHRQIHFFHRNGNLPGAIKHLFLA